MFFCCYLDGFDSNNEEKQSTALRIREKINNIINSSANAVEGVSGGSSGWRSGDRHPLGIPIFSFFLHKNEKIRVILP